MFLPPNYVFFSGSIYGNASKNSKVQVEWAKILTNTFTSFNDVSTITVAMERTKECKEVGAASGVNSIEFSTLRHQGRIIMHRSLLFTLPVIFQIFFEDSGLS